MKMEQTGCSERSEYKIQTQENYPEESIKANNRLSKFFTKAPKGQHFTQRNLGNFFMVTKSGERFMYQVRASPVPWT